MAVNMNPNAHYRSGWSDAMMMVRGPLTDKKIAQYEKKGFYSPEYRAARKEFAEKKRRKRLGNFDQMEDGRMIYRP